jgi:hypothetical protein
MVRFCSLFSPCFSLFFLTLLLTSFSRFFFWGLTFLTFLSLFCHHSALGSHLSLTLFSLFSTFLAQQLRSLFDKRNKIKKKCDDMEARFASFQDELIAAQNVSSNTT